MKKIIKATLLLLSLLVCFIGGFYTGLNLNIQNCEDLSSVASTTALELPNNKILLIKQNNNYAALKILKRSNSSAHYEWWYQKDGSGNFNSKSVLTGKGKVFEKYKSTQISKGRFFLEDAGSNLLIKINDIEMEWSAPNFIYYSNNYGLSLTDKTDIKDITIDSKKWLGF